MRLDACFAINIRYPNTGQVATAVSGSKIPARLGTESSLLLSSSSAVLDYLLRRHYITLENICTTHGGTKTTTLQLPRTFTND